MYMSAHNVALMAPHWPSITTADQKSPFPWEQNNEQLLEKAITLKQEGLFTITTFYKLNIVWQII